MVNTPNVKNLEFHQTLIKIKNQYLLLTFYLSFFLSHSYATRFNLRFDDS